MLDEDDGVSSFRLAVGGKAVFQGKRDLQDERMHWFSSPSIDLAPGDVLTLTVDAHAGERGRTVSRRHTILEPGRLEDIVARLIAYRWP